MLARGFSLVRRFSLCRILLKGQSGRNSVGQLVMPVGADVVKFDAGLRRVYIACSSGFIFVFHAEDEIHDRKREDFAVEKIVHSLAVDSANPSGLGAEAAGTWSARGAFGCVRGC